MNFLLEVTDYTKPIDNFGDTLLFGGQMLLIGMLTVFAVLILLWFTLTLFKLLFHNASSRGGSKPKAIKEETAELQPVYTAADDNEIIAVIAAAVAMAESECGNGAKFRVVSFKRK